MIAAGLTAMIVPPRRRLRDRLEPVGAGHAARRPRSALDATIGAPVLAVAEWVGRRIERRSDDALRLALRQAGRRDVTPDEFRARLAGSALLGAVAGAVLGVAVLHSAPVTLAGAGVGALAGAARSRGRLDRRIEQRAERIRLELVTVDQLLAMQLRTGAGPVQAIRRLVDRGSGVVVEELADVLDALRRGVAEPVAFRHAADLTPEPAAARTYRLFATGVERGVDLADGLRALSDDLRNARREEVRRSAVRRRAAMLVPTIAVLAPVMLLFIAAPLPTIVFGS
jgi:Flp pilus assembly protein TadB